MRCKAFFLVGSLSSPDIFCSRAIFRVKVSGEAVSDE